MIERRRNTAKKINALPFVVPEDFDAQYIADNGMANIIGEFDADESLTKRFSYAVHSCANSEDGLEPLVEISYLDKSIPTNPYPSFPAKPALRHYLPDIEGATYKVMEKLTDDSWNQLTIGIEDATCTYEKPIGSGNEFTFNAYGYGRSYVDFTVNSTHRYVIVYGASTEAVIPMDTVWFFLAGCTSISTENYSIDGQNNTTIYLTRYNMVNYIHLRDGLTTLNDEAFYGCASLRGDLVIPKGVKHVGGYCFYNTKMDGELVIEGVESAGARAFTQHSSTKSYFTHLRIAGSFDPLSAALDYATSSLQSFTILNHENNRYYEYNSVLYYSNGTETHCVFCPPNANPNSVQIKPGTTHILETFKNLTFSAELSIPDSVQVIRKQIFNNCPEVYGTVDFYDSALREFSWGCFERTPKVNPDGILRLGRHLESIGHPCYLAQKKFVVHPENPNFFTHLGVLYSDSSLMALPLDCEKPNIHIPAGVSKIGPRSVNNSNVTSITLSDATREMTYLTAHHPGFKILDLNNLEILYRIDIPFLEKMSISPTNNILSVDFDGRVATSCDSIHLIAWGVVGTIIYSKSAHPNMGWFSNYRPKLVICTSQRFTFNNKTLYELIIPQVIAPSVPSDDFWAKSSYASVRELHIPVDADGHLGDDTGYNRGNSCWQQAGIFGGGVHYDLVRIHGRITSANAIPDRFVVTEVGNTIQYDYDDGNGEVTVNMYQFTSPVITNEDGTIDYEVWVKLGKPYTLEFPNEANTVININVPSANKPSTGHDLEQDITI